MANYEYIARNGAGEEVAGAMQADNEASVLRMLDERKLFPVRVAERAVRSAMRGGAVKVRHLGVFYAQLSDLLKAGVPMLRALEMLTRAISNTRLSNLVRAVHDDVAAGRTLADAMGEHPEFFVSLHCAMVRAGERAGFLEDVLANLAAFLERQDDLRGKVRGALIYPIVLVSLGAAAMTFILTFLVPQFRTMFQGMPMPLPTTILFGASDFFRNQWPIALGLLLAAAGGLFYMFKTGYGLQHWDRLRLRIPIAGKVIRTVGITRFCRILGTMLANGVPILQSLGIAKDAAGCSVLAESIEKAADSVRAGEPLAVPLKAGGLFPPEILEMIAVAEESNQLEKVLVQIADTVERRTNRQVDQAVRLIEPLILVVIAGMIGFVAVGLMYPIFSMSRMLKH